LKQHFTVFLYTDENVSEHETTALLKKLDSFPDSDEGTSAAISQGDYCFVHTLL